MNTIVMSDIHIGTNYKTCWYQQSVHEPYMLALLDTIIQNANSGNTNRLIFLGDLFDFWTYPPDQRPPTIDAILAANPNLFAPNGKMRQVVEALKGNVLYLHGNHDITITQADLDRIPTGQYKIQLIDDVFSDDGTVYTHGHLYTMFNAPDPRYPGQIPVGHFVTRAISYMLENSLGPGQTAADLTNQGSPYGFSLSSLIPGLASQFSNPSITSVLLDYIAQRTQLAENTPILMADGTTTTITDVKAKYDGLWQVWSTQNGGGEIGNTVAAKAAQADYDGSYMAWFAQKAAFEKSALRTVMGHTHVPKVGIQNSWCQYINNGFECPSVPDITAGTTHFNFTSVGSDGSMYLVQVVKGSDGYTNAPATAPADQIVYAPFMDFSCYIKITNNSSNDLVKQNLEANNGYFVVPPPARIPANTTVEIWIQDLTGVHGAEGSVTYRQADGSGSMQFTFGCPTGIFSNYASGGAYFIATSGNPPNSPNPTRNSVPRTGHPLFVDFFVQQGSMLADVSMQDDGSLSDVSMQDDGSLSDVLDMTIWTPTSPLAQAVDLAGFDYDPTQDIIYSKMDALQRNFGYAYGYDAAALMASFIIDCEPIFFDYNGKHWMIELWKGQYMFETGCEIGVYNRAIGSSSPLYALMDATVGKREHDPVPSHNLFFDCAADNELLQMTSILNRNGQKLFSRGPERHWWLTGFKWGVLSKPEDLTMDVSITCLDSVMTTALVNALNSMGYQNTVSANTVSFTFATPKTFQPRTDSPNIVPAIENNNRSVVELYNSLHSPNNDPNTLPTGQVDSLILNSIATFGTTFFSQVVAHLLTQAGYSISGWVDSLENIFGINLNFSCIVELSNKGGPSQLILDDFGVTYGSYTVPPPQSIQPGEVGLFWLKDPKPSIHGAQGWVQYHYIDSNNNTQSVQFNYDCPTGVFSNSVTISPGTPFNFYTKSGDINSSWSGRNSVIGGGHPLFIAFVWGNEPPPMAGV